MTIRELYREGKNLLSEGRLEEADTDAFLLLEHVFSISRTQFYLDPGREAEPEKEKRYRALLSRRLSHEPVQYLTGEAFFFGRRFRVTPKVLIPRQDTEVLVEKALSLFPGKGQGVKILDLCTGSGCILLSLLCELPLAKGTGTDLSEGALQVAEENQKNLGTKAALWQGDLFDIEALKGERFSLITANPPYIASSAIEGLMPEVRDREPRLALDGGIDGLDLYRRICRRAPEFLEPQGVLLMEIGYDQGEAVKELCHRAGLCRVKVHKDLSGQDRVAEAHAGPA